MKAVLIALALFAASPAFAAGYIGYTCNLHGRTADGKSFAPTRKIQGENNEIVMKMPDGLFRIFVLAFPEVSEFLVTITNQSGTSTVSSHDIDKPFSIGLAGPGIPLPIAYLDCSPQK